MFRRIQSSWKFHRDGQTPARDDERWVLVFGSNLAGRHGAGAALLAASHFGAEPGVGVGFVGRSYAIPTKGSRLEVLPLDDIEQSVVRFLGFARSRPDLMFFVTRVGCGLAGYRDEQIAPLFSAAPANCSFSSQWQDFLEASSGDREACRAT